jgi:hypothetical protein
MPTCGAYFSLKLRAGAAAALEVPVALATDPAAALRRNCRRYMRIAPINAGLGERRADAFTRE